mgnify:FL=1
MDRAVGFLSTAFTSSTGKAVSGLTVALAICMYSFDFLKEISKLEFGKSCGERRDVYLYGIVFVLLVLGVTYVSQAYAWLTQQRQLESKVADLQKQTETLTGQLEDEKTKREAAEKERDDEKVIKIQAVTDCQTAKQLSTQLTQDIQALNQELGGVKTANKHLKVFIKFSP